MLDLHQQLADERSKDYQREALAQYQAREFLGQRRPVTAFYAPALDRLGHMLIATGLSLRSRYGRLELGIGEG